MGAQQISIAILRLIHILAGVFWVGTTLAVVRFLLPAVAATGPAGGVVMREIVLRRRLPVALLGSGGITILAGLGLYGFEQAGSNGAWAHSPMGITISIGAVLSIIAVIFGAVRVRPAAMKLSALGEKLAGTSGPPAADVVAEMDRLRAQLTSGTSLVAVLLVLATAAMAVARYV
jgi:hypothetical protein